MIVRSDGAVIEGFRTDSLYLFANVRISQVLSAVLVLVGILLLVLIKKGKLKTKPAASTRKPAKGKRR